MLKKKCPACAEKVERKFNYCPHCGVSFKAGSDDKDFGMLGRNDSNKRVQEELKLPFGMNKIMNSLVKQLESQLGNVDMGDGQGMPKGIKIRVARGSPMGQGKVIRQVPEKKVSEVPEVSDKENERRMRLPKVEVESKVKRLGDIIIYEVEVVEYYVEKERVIVEIKG